MHVQCREGVRRPAAATLAGQGLHAQVCPATARLPIGGNRGRYDDNPPVDPPYPSKAHRSLPCFRSHVSSAEPRGSVAGGAIQETSSTLASLHPACLQSIGTVFTLARIRDESYAPNQSWCYVGKDQSRMLHGKCFLAGLNITLDTTQQLEWQLAGESVTR